MTLHWWMHWFWITKPVAVATQLIFLLASAHAVPLPASTLDPQSHSSHHSRTPLATSWASGNEDAFENDKPTSVYVEQHRQTVVYEDGPVWSNSPDIEEPFYPTTASSDRLSNRDLPTESIPITPKSISKEELHTKTYLPKSFEKVHEYGSPTEFTSEYFSDKSSNTDDIVRNFDSIDKDDISQYPYKSNGELNLQDQITTLQDTHSSTQVNYISTTPKTIDYSIQQNNHVSFNTESNERGSIKQPPNYYVGERVTKSNDHSLTHSKKVTQRLVIRDLSNLSEPTFSSVLASHGSNSTDNENTSRPSPRASKAIGSFPHFSSSTSLDHKQEHISNPGKVEENPKTVHMVENNENATSKSPEHDSKSVVNPQVQYSNATKTNFNSSFSSSLNKTEKQNNENDNIQISNRRTYLESDSSKLAPDMYNKSVQSMNNTARKSSNVNSEGRNVSTSTSAIQNNLSNTSSISATEIEAKHILSSESPVPFDSNISQRITTLSDTEETGNLTPVHSHEFVGRSASLSHDTETTVEPSVAPVSRSRIAASPQDISHSGLDAASITGIALGIVVFAGLTGAVSFILYRRRYLNKPQTLNDKCSNPDSSGYIDDSTLRDNSEEMYSLDNDSFLNSLEAMTIQNYWTDNVKHTKL